MYYTLYELLNSVLFNGNALANTPEGNALTLCTLALTLMFAYLPFKLIINFVNVITDWRR